MKGVIFTQFLEMVETNYGYPLVDALIEETQVASGGAYTSVGTYPHTEMVALVSELSAKTGIPISTLLNSYGKYLFSTFTTNYGHFFEEVTSAFDMLESIESYIHVEVKKLYPDAELPSFKTTRLNNSTLEMIYLSERKMSDLAEGLIESTFNHFDEKVVIQKVFLDEEGKIVRFVLQKL